MPAKLHALALSAIVALPLEQLPAAIQDNLPTLLAKLVRAPRAPLPFLIRLVDFRLLRRNEHITREYMWNLYEP